MSKSGRARLSYLFASAGVLLALAACSSNSSGAAASSGHSPIEIGVVLSTSGTGAVYGVDQLNGVNLAVKFINAAGGVNGHPLQVDFQNSNYDKTQAQSIISKMAPDQSIVGIIGPTSSAEAFAADPIANSAKLPVLAISNGSTGVPQIGDYVHRVGVPEPLLLPGVVKAVVAKDHLQSAAILYANDDPFALTGEKAFSKALTTSGVSITDAIPYNSANTVNFVPQLETIKSHHPQALFLAVHADEGAVILRQVQQVHLNLPLVGNLAFTSTSLLDAAGNAANGLIVGGTWSPTEKTQLNEEFMTQYQKVYHKAATPLAATAFNAVYIIKMALANAKTYDRAALQQGMDTIKGYHVIGSNVQFVGVGGGLRDASTPEAILLQYENGNLVPVSG